MSAKLFFRTDSDVIECVGDFVSEDGETRGHWQPQVRRGGAIFGVTYAELRRVRAGVIVIDDNGTGRIEK
jgi:hypothetical protein